MDPMCHSGYCCRAGTCFLVDFPIRFPSEDSLCNLKTLGHRLQLGERAEIAKESLAFVDSLKLQNRLGQFLHFFARQYSLGHGLCFSVLKH